MTDGREERRLTLAELEETLKDPELVYLNMLRGGIAKPSIRQMLHLHGADALARWDSVEETAALRAEVAALRAAVEMAQAVLRRLHDDLALGHELSPHTINAAVRELGTALTTGHGESALRCVRELIGIAENTSGMTAEIEADIATARRLFGTGDSK